MSRRIFLSNLLILICLPFSFLFKLKISQANTKNIYTKNIYIKCGDKTLGIVQKVEISPFLKNDYPHGKCGRIRFNKNQIKEAFSRGFLNAKAQRLPLNFYIEPNHEAPVIKNAWISNLDYIYEHENNIIVDSMEFVCEKTTV